MLSTGRLGFEDDGLGRRLSLWSLRPCSSFVYLHELLVGIVFSFLGGSCSCTAEFPLGNAVPGHKLDSLNTGTHFQKKEFSYQ